MIFTISLLISCKTARTTESTQCTNNQSEEHKETHQTEDNKTILNMQADSMIIEETPSEIDIVSKADNIKTSIVKKPLNTYKRTIKIYGIHQNTRSSNKIVSKEKIQVKKKGTIRTTEKTKEEKPSSNTTFIGIVIVLLCLLMIAGLVAWKIAVQ